MPEMLDGRYQLDEPIGRGGMGEVWRGHDPRTGRAVAVKILAPQVTQPAARERFAREARAAAQIVHTNVVTVFDTGEQNGRPYLVMELLTGRSLADELADGHRYNIPEVCRLMSQAASGLDAAHKAGVVHRDVKPANLHRTADGTLKIVDFGIAQVASETSRLTTVGTVVGTAAYLAPEQINGEPGTAASDLYALGCVAYELLCGQPPFSGGAADLMRKHVFEAPAPPSQVRPDVPPGLDRLVLSMLAKDPADRPANAEQVRQAFAAFAFPATVPNPLPHAAPNPTAVLPSHDHAQTTDLRGTPAVPVTGAMLTGGGAPPEPSSPNKKLALQALAGVAVIAAVAIGVTLLNSGGGTPDPTPTPTPTSAAVTTTEPEPAPSASSTPEPSSLIEAETPGPDDEESDEGDDPYVGDAGEYTPADGWVPWLEGFDKAVFKQEAAGGIDPGLAKKAHDHIREAARLAQSGGEAEAREKALRVTRDLLKAEQKGKLKNGPVLQYVRKAGLG
ncbi:serine/threonine-protein kinase [Nonomuraea sp. NPDC049152]|uniref:serine/threonine-protein kinase n=1 Tax=Nonomuraea sp. NPDC049152 TaxID=3154350 RepID=UPI0033D7F7C4